MPGNVNINIPPRLIESARAAQYANREALDGRALVGKIKAKAQRAAAVQAKPPLITPVGGLLEESRKPDTWRIWRRRTNAAATPYILFVNSNASRDDNFTIKINETTVGDVDFSADNTRQAYLFIWTEDAVLHKKIKDIYDEFYTNSRPGLTWFVIPVFDNPPTLDQDIIIEMMLTQQNDNGNFGTIFLNFVENEHRNRKETFYSDFLLSQGPAFKIKFPIFL